MFHKFDRNDLQRGSLHLIPKKNDNFTEAWVRLYHLAYTFKVNPHCLIV